MKIKIDSKIKHLEGRQCSCMTLACLINAVTTPLAQVSRASPGAAPDPFALAPVCVRWCSPFSPGVHSPRFCLAATFENFSDAVTMWSPSLLGMQARILWHGLEFKDQKQAWAGSTQHWAPQKVRVAASRQFKSYTWHKRKGKLLDLPMTWGFHLKIYTLPTQMLNYSEFV